MRIDKCYLLNRILRVSLSWLSVYSVIAAYLMYMGEGVKTLTLSFVALLILCAAYLFFAKEKNNELVMQPGLMVFNLISIIMCASYSLQPGLKIEMVGLIIALAGYLTNNYFASYYDSLLNARQNESRALMSNFKKHNILFFSWLILVVIVALLALLLPYDGIGTAILNGIKALIAFLRGKKSYENSTGTTASYVEEEDDGEMLGGDDSGTGSYILLLLIIGLALIIGVIIILAKTLKDQKYKRKITVSEDDENVRETVRVISKKERDSFRFSIFGTPSQRIRKYFIKTVRGISNKKIKKSDTPAELINEITDYDRQLRDYYEMARYSKTDLTNDDVKKVKKLSEIVKSSKAN